jgi:hypothetical protein
MPPPHLWFACSLGEPYMQWLLALAQYPLRLAGRISVRALPSVDGAIIGERYIATVEESIEGKDLLDEERIIFTLLELCPLAPPSAPTK